MEYEYVIVGAGFWGATLAERLANDAQKNVLLIDRRDHVGGNSFSQVDSETGVEYHTYGSHIFHTSNEEVWNHVNRFTRFNDYRHHVFTTYRDRVYPMPISLATINTFYGLNLKPSEVEGFLSSEIGKEGITEATNLEEKAISLIGRPLYEAFVRGYTIKQWETDPTELSPDIITRLPVRYNYNNRYFNDTWEGIPLDGYGRMFEAMLDSPRINIELGVDYFDIRENLPAGVPVLYSGPIDRLFDYQFGRLEWRTINFELTRVDTPDYQGTTVMNYADVDVPFTRIHEFKHYHPERPMTERSLICHEYSRVAEECDEPYYPLNTSVNRVLLEKYDALARNAPNVILGGRLGSYRYLDMDDTIAAALECYNNELFPHSK